MIVRAHDWVVAVTSLPVACQWLLPLLNIRERSNVNAGYKEAL